MEQLHSAPKTPLLEVRANPPVLEVSEILNEEGAAQKVLRTLTSEPRSDSGLDSLICTEFTRKRHAESFVSSPSLLSSLEFSDTKVYEP